MRILSVNQKFTMPCISIVSFFLFYFIFVVVIFGLNQVFQFNNSINSNIISALSIELSAMRNRQIRIQDLENERQQENMGKLKSRIQ